MRSNGPVGDEDAVDYRFADRTASPLLRRCVGDVVELIGAVDRAIDRFRSSEQFVAPLTTGNGVRIVLEVDGVDVG